MFLIFFLPLSSREIYSQLARWESWGFLVRRDENFRQFGETFFHLRKIGCAVELHGNLARWKVRVPPYRRRAANFARSRLQSSPRLVALKSECVFSSDENKAFVLPSSMIIVRMRGFFRNFLSFSVAMIRFTVRLLAAECLLWHLLVFYEHPSLARIIRPWIRLDHTRQQGLQTFHYRMPR